MIQGINHVGVAVKNLDDAVAFLQNVYGGVLISRTVYESERFESALVRVGGARIELLAGTDSSGLIAKFVGKRGEGIHHVSLQVDQFDDTLRDLKTKGLRVISEADTKEFKAAFIHPSGNLGVLTEIIEPKQDHMRVPYSVQRK